MESNLYTLILEIETEFSQENDTKAKLVSHQISRKIKDLFSNMGLVADIEIKALM